MNLNYSLAITLILYFIIIDKTTNAEMNIKNFPRPRRASRAPDDFENFFLKASKSVPRIGRRDFDMNAKYYAGSTGFYNPNSVYPKVVKKYYPMLKDLPWNDIADKVEYYPEIFVSPNFLASESFKDFDSFDYDADNQNSKKIKSPNKEVPEFI